MSAPPAEQQPVRVALYGNMCNFLYQIAKALRMPEAGAPAIDAHLYVERTADLQNLPESDEPQLAGAYPDWVHVGDWMHGVHRVLGVACPALLPAVKAWGAYDLLMVSAEGPGAARFTGKPYMFLTGGGDLTLMPFAHRHASLDAGAGMLKAIAWRLRAHWQRAGILGASVVVTQPFRPFTDALRELGVAQSKIASTTSLLTLDTDQFKRVENTGELPQALRDADFIVFQPSRMMIRDDPVLRATGQWKANDVLLRGFAAFVATGAAARPRLALIERSHSPDLALAKAEINRLGITQHVAWLRGPTAEGFSRHDLFRLYSASDVVADDFGAGWFGSVALEACAAECPVLTYVDEQAMAKMYPWHPFVNARTEQDIADQLGRMFGDPASRRAIGRRGREWVMQFHAPRPHRDRLRAELARLISR
jgi:hypothetical protein